MGKIIGYENEVNELLQLKRMLLNTSKIRDCNLKIPRGLVIYGEAGVGKTQMARSLAGDGIGLFEVRAGSCSCSDAKKEIEDSFIEAKLHQPAIILLDELDKMIDKCEEYYTENDYISKILIKELDSLSDQDNILIVVTCSFYQALGDALICPGRFNRRLFIDFLDSEARMKILRGYFELLNVPNTIDYEYLSRFIAGYSGAEIESLVNDVGIYALENNVSPITFDDVYLVINRSIYGCAANSIDMDEDTFRNIAIHEAGHGVIALTLMPNYIFATSILPQGNASGHVHLVSTNTRNCSLKEIENEVIMLLGGHVAERICGGYKKGASEDLRKARQLVEKLTIEEGAYGYEGIIYNTPAFELNAGPAMKDKVSKCMVDKLYEFDKKAESIIIQNKPLFDEIVKTLLERKVLLYADLFDLKKRFLAVKVGDNK